MEGRILDKKADTYLLILFWISVIPIFPFYICNIYPKEETENNLQFGKRVIKEIVLNTVKANALRTDRFRYNEEKDWPYPCLVKKMLEAPSGYRIKHDKKLNYQLYKIFICRPLGAREACRWSCRPQSS